MELSAILLAVITLLGATAICVILFERIGFGSVLGFIVAGIIIGPHTPGPVLMQDVHALQRVAELGVVLFLFIVGLEMRPEKMWSMRRLLFGLGSAQVLVTATLVGAYMFAFVVESWQSATVLGLGFAMASTAIIITVLAERGQLASDHGQTSFAIVMAQDLWFVPIMALVPILGQKASQAPEAPVWAQALLVVGVIAAIFVAARYLLPAALGYTAKRRQMNAFGYLVFLAVLAAAWAVEHAGISMTLGAFLVGILLSASDYRYQIEAIVSPFKESLMGLFFLAVGMSIDVGALLTHWPTLATHLPVVLVIKVSVVIALVLAFGIARASAIRTAFLLSQVGELAFVLFGAAAVAGLLEPLDFTLAMLGVALSMILTPVMVKVGETMSSRLQPDPASRLATSASGLDRHVVVIGFEEVGRLVCLLLNNANIPHVVFDRDIDHVRKGKQWGHAVQFGDMYDTATQQAAGLGKAAAALVTSDDNERAKALAVTLHRLYPNLDVYVRVRSLADQDELASRGIKHAGTVHIESTLLRGAKLLKDLGVPEEDVEAMVRDLQLDNYERIRAAYAEPTRR